MKEEADLDETSQKIIDAAMTLVRDKGYVATTTKEIAKAAGVNECTPVSYTHLTLPTIVGV